MTNDREAQLAAALGRVVELFAAICAAPDDPTLAARADEALAEVSHLALEAPAAGG
ncbi:MULTISPECIES: hypothetical protein [unclassified Solwaraspora]|uniref:hypothetical protein n=1 Tax=unclassified Solwaraspora TaxID=2627926 RepID=UPI00248B95DF|nr:MULTISPECIES: hypothetical protein [unclassified Solwaraspora]WBB95657.1 hypothetical protein O7553_20055 [Solwaraspora sp. WMMA2059]WBC20441.1 hypothetical protein O7543_27325 [Solwaraspora sp. WMMA2080]WJK37408.1 hypothetical protein O7610_14265 [Solwaraspora sp. WMMA2065]